MKTPLRTILANIRNLQPESAERVLNETIEQQSKEYAELLFNLSKVQLARALDVSEKERKPLLKRAKKTIKRALKIETTGDCLALKARILGHQISITGNWKIKIQKALQVKDLLDRLEQIEITHEDYYLIRGMLLLSASSVPEFAQFLINWFCNSRIKALINASSYEKALQCLLKYKKSTMEANFFIMICYLKMHQRKQAEERHKLMKKMVAANLYEKELLVKARKELAKT
uniref:Uncharacterized protein n=2 Tax=Meloidogyne TaxID=189290 RepID=A0A6V7UPH0_MELEN|nr:unnamed protein product [Meloidogyne enterolobii]